MTMKTRTLPAVFGVIGLAVFASMASSASVPLGVFAVIDKVVLEPADGAHQRIQIWGAFARWDEATGIGYRAPERGYLYYGCSRERMGTCRNEWADLKSVAGTGEIVGFGSRALAAGRVRSSGERASAPDGYPIQFGISRMGSPRGDVFDRLKALARAR